MRTAVMRRMRRASTTVISKKCLRNATQEEEGKIKIENKIKRGY
jgi:hypothetical protein